jgi:twitching motility protein PilT
VKTGLVTYDEALKNVSNADDFALRFRGIASTSDGTWDDFEKDGEEKPDASPSASKASSSAPAESEDDLKIERF